MATTTARDPSSTSSPAETQAATLKASIDAALAKIDALQKTPGSALPPDVDQVVAVLQRAQTQLDLAKAHPLGLEVGVDDVGDYELSSVRSALDEPAEPPSGARVMGRSIVGFQQYEDLDGHWLATLWSRVTYSKLPFPVAPSALDQVFALPDDATIAIAGDWGTGNASSLSIKTAMAALNPTHTVHLGDVYYSGTEAEEKSKFVDVWPEGTIASLALNSNHEMYAGGHGYFGTALASPKFRLQRGHSYFALSNSNWLVIGLDSAYSATHFYDRGALSDPQVLWLHTILGGPTARRADGTPKTLIVLTHHQGLEDDGSHSEPLWSQVVGAIQGFSAYWYWGHIHNVAAFKDVPYPALNGKDGGVIKGRLIGHGGVPYAADPLSSAMLWTESGTFGDPRFPQRAANGFVLLTLDGPALGEKFFDERGALRWPV